MSGNTRKPRKVYLSPFEYKINWLKAAIGNESYDGDTCTSMKEISINMKLPEQALKETLLHEICHVLLEDVIEGVLKFDTKEDAEEFCIRMLSPRLFSFLRKNHEVLEFLFGDINE